jgi:polyphosphate kinase
LNFSQLPRLRENQTWPVDQGTDVKRQAASLAVILKLIAEFSSKYYIRREWGLRRVRAFSHKGRVDHRPAHGAWSSELAKGGEDPKQYEQNLIHILLEVSQSTSAPTLLSVSARSCTTICDNRPEKRSALKRTVHLNAPSLDYDLNKVRSDTAAACKIIAPLPCSVLSSGKERCHMAKDKQQKHSVAERKAASAKMKRKEFEKELAKLQVELTRLQTWVQATGARIIVVFEGRDTAGKGGVISRITSRTSPRVYRHVALPAPSDREKTQVYPQRYIAHFPAAGEIILFDRSWYNRAGVERVMGFCTEQEAERFLLVTPAIEREMVVQNGIILRKYFLDISQDEQRRRFEARIKDPLKHWKLSPMDIESVRRWWDYTAAYQRMIEATHTPEAPWYIVPADDKRRARLNLIRHLLDSIPYKKVHADLPKIPKSQLRPKGATESLGPGVPIPSHY